MTREELREVRTALGLSSRGLARLADVTQKTVLDFENGKTQYLSRKVKRSIEEALQQAQLESSASKSA